MITYLQGHPETEKGNSAVNREVHVFASVISYVNLCNRFSYFRIFE